MRIEALEAAMLNFVQAYARTHGYEWRRTDVYKYQLWRLDGGGRLDISVAWDNERLGWALGIGMDPVHVLDAPEMARTLDFAAMALRG